MDTYVQTCLFLLGILSLTGYTSSQQLECDTAQGWYNLDGSKCYRIFTDDLRRTYERAASICESYGSRLVIIKDQYENDKVAQRVAEVAGKPETFYIGLSKVKQDTCSTCADLLWSNGEPATDYYGFWSDDQPDDANGDCVYVKKNQETYVYDRPYTWNYGNCLTKRSFVCERMAAPQFSFHCFSGGFVSQNKICNGIPDCNDGSDELSCEGRCHFYHRGASGALNTSPFPYSNAQTCTWAIETPVGTNVYVKFTNVDTEAGADIVDIYSGSVIETKAKRIDKISGTYSSKIYRSCNNMMFIKFSSDAFVTRSGFQATYDTLESPEGHTIPLIARRAASQMFTLSPVLSDVVGFNSFLPMYDYVIVIETESQSQLGPMITLKIEEATIDKDDKLMFFDGKTPSDPLLATYCHSDDCTNYHTVYSTGHSMSILLSTKCGLMNDVTFKFSYRQGCYFESTDNYGTIFTPGFPNNINYPNYVQCTWSIDTDKPIAIYFDSESDLVDEDYNRPSNGDFLEMNIDGNLEIGNSPEGLATNEFRGKTFLSNGSIELMLKTSPTRSSRGFQATWSIACKNPEFDANTIVSTSETVFYYTSSMTISCANGYDFHQEQIAQGTASVELECGYMGFWKTYRQIPKCTPNYCGDVPDITNGYIESSTGPVYGSTATYQCYQGSTLQPALGGTGNTITCQANGVWSARPTCNARSCPNTITANIANGQATGSGNSIGSIYSFVCDSGYKIVGDPIIFCQEDGTWTQNNEPTCERLQCWLPNIENGYYNFNNFGSFINYETSVNVGCDTGYENTGNATVRCTEDRSLDGTPVCTNIDECMTTQPCQMDCYDTVGSFYCTCRDGYELLPDGRNCRDINECILNTDQCDGDCTNLQGGYECSCTDPYVLFTEDLTSGFGIPTQAGENGLLPSDTYHINHTCVFKTCDTPRSIDNGVLLTKSPIHRYNDHIEYQCNIGYLPRRSTLRCGANGNWVGTVPTCSVATCAAENPINLLNRASYLPGPYNYNYVLELNCSRADGDFKKYRYCTYNKVSDRYEMQGSSYECGEVDCGVPVQYSGTRQYNVASTTFDSSFTFECSNGGLTGTTNAGSTSIVRCLADGYWDFGNLQCTGQSCSDPGFPLGGDLVATSFADQSDVTFVCLRPGYTLSQDTTLTCQGSNFFGAVPSCIDTTKPVINNCPTESIVVPRYSLLRNFLPNLSAEDNDVVDQFYVTPSNANSTLYVNSNMTVTYTAMDPAGNTEQCIIVVEIIDVEPPTIQCPPLRDIFLSTSEEVQDLMFGRDDFILNDNRDFIKSFKIINPPPSSYDITTLYRTYTYSATAFDSNDNSATCRGQMFVQPDICSDLSFLNPLNGQKTCTTEPGGARNCVVRCDQGYTFEDAKQKTIRCVNNQWDTEWLPACVLDTLRPEITCPVSTTIYLSVEGDTRTIDFTSLSYNADDLNDINTPIYSEESYEFTFADLYQRRAIQMSVSDVAGNTETCRFEYTVLPNPWSPLALTKPLFSDMTCVRRLVFPTGYDCTITCDAGKILRNVGPSTTVSSNDNGAWSDSARFPACVDDTKPPIITACPASSVEEISAGDEVKSITFVNDVKYLGLYEDLSGIGPVRYQPESVSLTAANLYSAIPIVMYVADNAGNEASCRFEILVRPSPCSELALPNPINGDKSCTYNSFARSWTCDITCNNGYSFYQTAASTLQTTCSDNVPFIYVPDCVRDDLSVQPQFRVTLSYDYVPEQDTVSTVSQSCVSHYADEVAFPPSSSAFSQMEDRLFSACDNVFSLSSLSIQMQPASTEGRVINNRNVQMNFTYIMSNSDSSKYQDCVSFVATQIIVPGNTFPLAENINGDGSSCPTLKWTSNAEVVRSGSYCSIPYFESPSNNFACLRCPVGTVSDSVTCTVCGIGTYNDGNTNTCQDCPIGYTTYTPGATSSSQCVAPCTSGRISDTGYLPCYSCPKGTYATDSRTCTPCEPGNTTNTVGSTSPSQCFPSTTVTDEPCSIGTEDVGNNVCELCPLGTYRSGTFQQGCVPCSDSFSTYVLGSTSSSQCYSKCSDGFVSGNGLAPCTPCPKGSYQYNTTTCLPCGLGRTTWGLGSVFSQCVLEANLRVKCPRGTERNSTTEVCEKCPVGYSNNQEEGTCVVCPATQSTYFPGATSSLMCRSKCPPGFYSSSGLSPCSPCGTSRYSSVYGATSCQSCDVGQTTATETSTGSFNCISQCQPGTYSYNGYNGANGCSQCPANYYQSNAGASSCTQCNPDSTYSTAIGRTSVNDCVDASSLCDNRCQHGTCSIRNNEPVCNCPVGEYYGNLCQFTVNHCLSNPCYNNGTCSQTLGGFTCDCRGYATGDRCQNLIDTCDTSQQNPTCKNGGHCINYAGYTRCLCRNGFRGSTCENIADICETSPCDQVGRLQCIDTSKDGDLRRHCVCKPGYEGDRCEINTDECSSNPCINGGTCNDGINSFSCRCPQGYGGSYCQTRTNSCQNVNCANSNDNQAMCVDVYGIDQYMCLCNKGYSYDNSGYAQYSMDRDTVPSAIDNSQPNQGIDTLADCRDLCTSQLSSCVAFSFDSSQSACYLWNANTDLGDTSFVNYPLYRKDIEYPDDDFWSLRYNIINNADATRNGLAILGIDICGGTEPLTQRCCRKGQECDINSDCNFQVDNNVNDYHIQYKCSVNRVFNRNTCTTKSDYCQDSPCQNGGNCFNQFGGYRCSCPTGYTGLNCQTNINECANDPCLHGTCTDEVGFYTCACEDGYTGTNCNNPVNFCVGVTCSSNGACSNIIGVGYECTCNMGFTGNDCESKIQYCDRNPCIHGTCELNSNSYRCVCDEGWQGAHCDVLTNYCSLQQHGLRCLAECNNIFKGYYCNCPSNTYGVNCENQPSPCINYNRCLNGGSCSDDNNVMTCACPANYKGDGCETLIDYCGQTNPCMNGAACRVTESSYQCMCAEGFNGALCENPINYCTGVSCPGGTCVNLRHQHYCRCPLGKTGANCNRDVDTNYDLYFNHPEGYGFAWIPFSVQVDNTNVVSIATWVRYARDGGTGVYMTQFLGDNLETATRFIEFDDAGVTIYLPGNTVERIEYDRNAVFNDGNWHHVVVTCFLDTGIMNLYMDTILFGPVVSQGLVMPDASYRMWVVLGCEFDNENQRCEMNGDNFHGYLSQVNFYKRELTFNGNPGDISYNYVNPRHVFGNVLTDLSLMWNEYVLETGVTRMIPSEAHGVSCNVLNRQPPCNFYTVTSVPTVSNCPSDIRVYSPERTVTVRWDEPVFDNIGGGNVLYPTRTPGSTFAWGVHDITYVAVDEFGNRAYCSFKIYVDSSNCENPEDPFGGRQQCSIDSVSDREGCMISCVNGASTYKIDRVHPLLFTCGPSGTWNAAKPFQQFRYPACGVIKPQPTKRAYIRVTYDIATSACNAVKTQLRARTLESLRSLNSVFAGTFCSSPDCSDVTITITCGTSNNNGRRKRQTNPLDFTTLMEILIDGADGSVVLNGETISLEEFLTYFILGDGQLDFADTIPSGNIDRENYAIVVGSSCPTGEVLLDGDCVECGPGNYYSMDAAGVAFCHDCPYGSYQPLARQTSCTNCTLGFTTELPGSYEATACKRSCPIGEYFDNGADDCRPCPIGYYQDEVGQFRCKFCDAGFTTKDPGSTSISDCSTSCDHGEQLNSFGVCEPCPIGQYRNATSDRTCVPCSSNYITASTASKSVAECTIAACSAGNYRDVDLNECFSCPLNTYQPEKWQTQCLSCGDATHWRTDSTGKSKIGDCLYYCPSGFEVESVGSCAICPVGTYKDNNEDKQGNCATCPGNYRTPAEGSISRSNCTIYKCEVGFYPNNLNNGCRPCAIGTYQDVPYSTNCKACNLDQSTRQVASNSSVQCETYCPSGQEKHGDICVKCLNGTYKNNNDGLFGMCVECNSLYTTATDGSDDVSDCNIRTCPPGTRRNAADTGCVSCPLGTYQPQYYQTTCLTCPAATSTRNVNSTSRNDCQTFCSSGYEKVGSNCIDCPVGYYKDNNNDGLFASCQLCPTQYITSGMASTSVSACNVANCSAGTYRDANNACIYCPKGFYQDQKWQLSCLQCGQFKTTENAGADDLLDCILECDPGYEDIGGTCQRCGVGYYKVESAAAACTQCPSGFITVDRGSTSATQCTIPACPPGEYLDRSNPNDLRCQQCAYDTYQNQRWQDTCLQCPGGRPVTLQMASDEFSDCVLDCDSGREYDFLTQSCQFCARGYYRNKNDRLQTGCQLCPSNRITSIEGSTSINACNEANCTAPGTYRDIVSNTCKACPVGTYQYLKWQTSCISCPSGNSTSSTGSASLSDCKSICPAGEYVGSNNRCEQCNVGYYKSDVDADTCTQCPNGLLTPGRGSDNEADCSISPCVAGQRYVMNSQTCVKCEIGSYQPNGGRFQCIDCPYTIKYTAREGAVSIDECKSTCQAGQQFVEATSSCEDCPVGTYQPDQFQFECVACPANRRYSVRGSTNLNQCYSLCSPQGNNDCSLNATCALSNNAQGYTCTCFNGYDDIGLSPGLECKHTCDRGYCKNSGTCNRNPQVTCTCTEWYTGARCQSRVRADTLSDDTMDIIIPASIAGGGLLLLLIILAVCCLCWRNSQKTSRPQKYSEFNGDRIDKVSVHSYGQPLYTQQPQMLMLAPAQEVVYDNSMYSKEPAVFQA